MQHIWCFAVKYFGFYKTNNVSMWWSKNCLPQYIDMVNRLCLIASLNHLFVLRYYGQCNGVMLSTISLPNHTFTGQSSKRLTSVVHILSPETDYCPSWISRREIMTVENISWSISKKECCRPDFESYLEVCDAWKSNVCLCWGFTTQSTQWGHVEHSQFT